MSSGLNESYQLLLIGLSSGVSVTVSVMLCRKYYLMRLAALQHELARSRHSLSVAQDLLAQTAQPAELRRSMRLAEAA